MEKTNQKREQIRSYLALRKCVGLIGMLLPFVLMLGVLLVFDEKAVRRTISLYYHTGMRDVFVGAVCAIALFMFFYKGRDNWDDWTGNFAGLFAVGIALFPTVAQKPYNCIAKVHFICAIAFFVLLVVFTLVLFPRKDGNPKPRKLLRNVIYYVCGSIMVACLGAILIFMGFFDARFPESAFVFWAETVALVAFGISWLVKGGTILRDKPEIAAGNMETQ
jgi:hypothetical protein